MAAESDVNVHTFQEVGDKIIRSIIVKPALAKTFKFVKWWLFASSFTMEKCPQIYHTNRVLCRFHL